MMDVITPKPVVARPPGRKMEFTCRCREVLRVWEEDVQTEMIVFDTGKTEFMAWFVCAVCTQKTHLSFQSQHELLTPSGPDIPYK